MPNPVIQVKKSLNDLEVLGRRLDSVRSRLAQADSVWKQQFYGNLLGQLLREWRHSINDYDNKGYRYTYPCEINSVRSITSANGNSLN
jgi:hypothetical protein